MTEVLEFIAKGRDDASSSLNRIRGNVIALTKSMENLNQISGKQAQALGKEMLGLVNIVKLLPQQNKHIQDHTKAWKDMREGLRSANEGITKELVPALSALGLGSIAAGVGLGELISKIKEVGQSGRTMLELSRQLALPREEIEKWTGLAPAIGTTKEAMVKMLTDVSSQMARMKSTITGGPLFSNLVLAGYQKQALELRTIARGVGTDAEKSAAGFKILQSVIRDVFVRYGEPAARLFAQQLGETPDIVNTIRRDVGALGDELKRLRGPDLDPKMLDAYGDSMTRMGDALDGLGKAVLGPLLPRITEFNDTIASFIGQNQQEIGDNIAKAIRDIGKAAKESLPDLSQIKEAIRVIQLFNAASAGSPAQRAATTIREHGGQSIGDYLKSRAAATPVLPGVNPLRGFFGLPKLQSGGTVEKTGIAVVHAGESFTSAGQQDEQLREMQENTKEQHENTEQLRKLVEALQFGPLGAGGGGFRPGIGGMPSGYGGGDTTTTSGAPSAPGAGVKRFPGQPTLDTSPRARSGTTKPPVGAAKPSSVVPLPQARPSTAGPQFPKEFDPSKHQYLIPNMQEGGVVQARPGGTVTVIGENGQDEAVVPLGRTNIQYRSSDSSTWGPARNNNPGSMAFNSAAGRYFGATSNTQIGPVKSDYIADFPTPVLGAASSMFLASTSPRYVGQTIAAGQTAWAPHNARVLPGFDPNTIITPELTHNEDFMIKFMKSTAEAEGFTTPMTDADWHSAFLRKEAAQAREEAGLPPPNPTGADGFVSGRPYTSPQFPATPGTPGVTTPGSPVAAAPGAGLSPNLMPGLLSSSGPSAMDTVPGGTKGTFEGTPIRTLAVKHDPNLGGVFQNENAVAALESARAAMPPGTSPATPEGRALINKYLHEGGRGLSAPQTAWCAATIMSGYKHVGASDLVRAQNDVATSFSTLGMPVTKKEDAQPGDIAVFRRGLSPGAGGGHVMFVRAPGGSDDPLRLYGGNTGSAMSGSGGGFAKDLDASDALIKQQDIIIRHPPESAVQQFILGKEPMSGGKSVTETFRPGPTKEAAAAKLQADQAAKAAAAAPPSESFNPTTGEKIPSHQSYQGGATNVPGGLAYLHKGEMVLPRHVAEQVRGEAPSGGGFGGGQTDPTIDLRQRSAQNRADLWAAAKKWYPGRLMKAALMHTPEESLATIQHARNPPDDIPSHAHGVLDFMGGGGGFSGLLQAGLHGGIGGLAQQGLGMLSKIPQVGQLGSMAEQALQKIEGSADLNVNVNAPPGTNVRASAEGLFKKVMLNRNLTMPTPDSLGIHDVLGR